MRLVGKLQGVCLVRFTPEEIMPEQGGVQIPSLVALLTATYQVTQNQMPFDMLQPLGALPGLIPNLTFTNGQISLDEQTISIKHISLANNGITVSAQDTESANKIMDHVFSLLNTQLKFRFEDLRRRYFSSLVVQFEKDIEGSLKGIRGMQSIVQLALGKKTIDEIALKRLAFGPEGKGQYMQVTIDNIDELDFAIERRAGQPFSDNRYFSSAPLRTPEHLSSLEQIEKLLVSSEAAN
jgi:hypothetical protein